MKTEQVSYLLVSQHGREVMGFDDEAKARERKRPFQKLVKRTLIKEELPD